MNASGPLTEFDIVIRLCFGFLAGGIIGLERSSHRQVAGLRTHILITLGSTSLMLLSIWLPQSLYPDGGIDPGRIAAQVVSGIGFLGAGAIIRLGNNIRGLTTAASLWLVAAIGLTIGAGMYIAAAAAEALSLITLVVLSRVERKIFPEMRSKLLEIHYNNSASVDVESVLEILKKFGVQSQSMDEELGDGKKNNTKLSFMVVISDADVSRLARELKSSGNISRVEIKESFT